MVETIEKILESAHLALVALFLIHTISASLNYAIHVTDFLNSTIPLSHIMQSNQFQWRPRTILRNVPQNWSGNNAINVREQRDINFIMPTSKLEIESVLLRSTKVYKSTSVYIINCISPFCKSLNGLLSANMLSFNAQLYFVSSNFELDTIPTVVEKSFYHSERLHFLSIATDLIDDSTIFETWAQTTRHHSGKQALFVTFRPLHDQPKKCENDFQHLGFNCTHDLIVVANLASMFNFTPEFYHRNRFWMHARPFLRIIDRVMPADYFKPKKIVHEMLDYVLNRKETRILHLMYCLQEKIPGAVSILVWFQPFAVSVWICIGTAYYCAGLVPEPENPAAQAQDRRIHFSTSSPSLAHSWFFCVRKPGIIGNRKF